MGEKLLLNCVFHDEHTPSMMVDKDSKRFECFSCGEHGEIKDYEKVRLAIIQHVLGNDNVHFGTFRETFVSRASDCYPLQIVLNSGVVIDIEEMTDIHFYDDYIEIPASHATSAKIHYLNDKSDFSARTIWIPYASISFITDAAS